METTALVIIDMQNSFTTSKDTTTTKNVLIQIKKAKKDNVPILVLEYVGHGETKFKIKRSLKKYEKVYYVKKVNDNGSVELMLCVCKHKINVQRFIVCGVNISFCVAGTTSGLVEKYKKRITVIKNACNCDGSKNNGDRDLAFNGQGYTKIYQHQNVTLVWFSRVVIFLSY